MDFVRLFESFRLPYAVLGGLATRTHGIPRPTWDVDFAVAVDRSRLPVIFDAAESLGHIVPAAYRSGWVDTVAQMPLVKFGVAINNRSVDIDVFLAESEYLNVVLGRRIAAAIDERDSVFVVSPEDLIILKTISSRPRDQIDIQDVLFIQGELDREYMRHWAARLGILKGLTDSLDRFDQNPVRE